MTKRLFEDLVVSACGRRRTRGGYALPASLGIHAAVLCAAIALPALGPVELVPEVTARPLNPPVLPTIVRVPPPRPVPANPGPRPSAGRQQQVTIPAMPRRTPTVTETALTPTPPDVLLNELGCLEPSCMVGTSLDRGPRDGTGPSGGSGGGDAPPAAYRAIVDVAPPMKLRNVDPVYPELARRAGVEGVVIIECTIDPRGWVAGARVLRGHPLLDAAALDAVQQWLYRPTLLNGAPVSVVMTVTVNFRLTRQGGLR